MWLFGFLSSSLGILAGGMIAWLFKGLQQKVDFIYGLCAGIIFGLISFEMLPESIELGGSLKTFVGFVIGMMLFKVLHVGLHVERGYQGNLYIHTGILLLLSFSIHNVPIGILLATSQQSDFTIALLQALFFHSIPEGIILFTPLILAGMGVPMGLLISCIVSIPILIGILLGTYLEFDHESFNTAVMSVTLGLIFMVTVSEILYPALKKTTVYKVILCVLTGLTFIMIYLKLL